MNEQMGWRALARGVRDEAPAWAGMLPQLPRLAHQALTDAPRQQAAQQQRLEQLAAGQRLQGRMLAVVGALAAALLGLELYRLFG
jgi:ubiquinone biosynthesis protein